MNSMALAQSGPDAYGVQFSAAATEALAFLAPRVANELRRRLQEISEVVVVGEHLGFTMYDGAENALRLELQGYVVSYVIDDTRRELTVLRIDSQTAK
jgi:mRNA-degrading endonuclease RelE of RelBE toxin-antitoxin system